MSINTILVQKLQISFARSIFDFESLSVTEGSGGYEIETFQLRHQVIFYFLAKVIIAPFILSRGRKSPWNAL